MKADRYVFLDGLRGWAALVVLLYHVFVDGLPSWPGAATLEPWLPFDGLVAVYIFFIISGFALSVRYLETGDLSGWTRIAAGRYFRLAIPILGACAILHVALVSGLVAATDDRLPLFRGWLTFSPTIEHLLKFSLFDVFARYDWRESYIGPLWTMAPELYGSALTLSAALILRPLRFRSAILVVIAAALFLLSTPPAWYLAFFIAGIVAADWHERLERAPILAGPVLFAIGSAPLLLAFQSWGAISACLLFAGCMITPAIRRALELPFSVWLGRISFPLYLMHGPVISVVGEPLMRNHGSIASGTAIQCLVVAGSFFAAVLFLPVNAFAIRVSRAVGAAVTSAPRPSRRAA